MPQSKRRTKRKSGKGKPKTPQEAAAPKIVGGALVKLTEGPNGQIVDVQPVEGTTVRECPTLLRQAAQKLERQLIGD